MMVVWRVLCLHEPRVSNFLLKISKQISKKEKYNLFFAGPCDHEALTEQKATARWTGYEWVLSHKLHISHPIFVLLPQSKGVFRVGVIFVYSAPLRNLSCFFGERSLSVQ